MNREEFQKRIRPLSRLEKLSRDEPKRYGRALQESHAARRWQKDDKGYYVFSNRGMANMGIEKDMVASDKLHAPIFHGGLNDHLRLIIHRRFNEIPFHSTEFISVNYVYSGRLILNFPGEEKPLVLHTGQLIFMNTGVVHSISISSEDDIVLGFQIERDFLSDRLLYGLSGSSAIVDFLLRTMTGEASDFSYLIAGFENDDRIRNLMEDIFCEYMDPGSVSDQLVENYIRVFFTLLVRNQSSLVRMDTRADVLAILNYIEEHCEDITLQKLAEQFSFNSKYLSNLIRKKSGRTFMEILTQARLSRIMFMLKSTDLPVSEIAVRCGYTNMTFFYQKFRERYGCMPKDVRKNIQ